MFKVYYAAVPVQPILFHVDLPFSVELLPVTHRLVCELDVPDRERVFIHMQGEVWSPHGEARALIASLGLHHTSMSVGDVVRDEEGVYSMCASLGWERLPEILSSPQRERLLAALNHEIGRLRARGEPRSATEEAVTEQLLAWQDALRGEEGTAE